MKLIVSTILLLSLFVAKAQNNKSTIKALATEMGNASLNSNWETVVDYTYPKIVQLLGGKEQMLTVLANSMQQQPIEFISVDMGEPGDIYSTGDNLFSLVPQTIIFKMPNGRVKTESYLLAISENNGEKWYFIDTAQLTMENVKEMLPNYNMDLTIPPKKQPIFLRN